MPNEVKETYRKSTTLDQIIKHSWNILIKILSIKKTKKKTLKHAREKDKVSIYK